MSVDLFMFIVLFIIIAFLIGTYRSISIQEHSKWIQDFRENTKVLMLALNQVKPDLQQYTMNHSLEYQECLESIDLSNKNVLELGVGEGALSQMIWEQSPKSWTGYEIDDQYQLVPAENQQLIIGDFTKVNFSHLCEHWCLISNPPYNTLKFIEENILTRIYDAIIMIPQSKRDKYVLMGFELVTTIDGTDFTPSSEGKHLVMKRGFK